MINLPISLSAGLCALAVLAVTSAPARADATVLSAPLAAVDCQSRIQFPEHKEELTGEDVRLAIEQHLLRIGATPLKVWTQWLGEEYILADIIAADDRLLRRLKVDAVEARIVSHRNFTRPVGFSGGPLRVAIDAGVDAVPARVAYRRNLRRHMLGDGKAWAAWLTPSHGAAGCQDDYRFGGPTLEPDEVS